MKLPERIKSFIGGGGLKARAARGGLWLGTGNGVEQGIRFIRNMALTRILAPEAMGLMAIISAVNAALESFAELGVREAIVQSPFGDQDTYLNSAWFLSFFRALVLVAIGVTISPGVLDFYRMDYPPLILRVSFLSILFSGLISVKAYLALKRMDYKKWVIIFQGGGICGTLTTLTLVFFVRNVWALVIGFVVESGMRCLLSYVVCPHRPRFKFNPEHTRALKKFSLGMFGLPIFYFIFIQADIFVLGRICTKAELGLYSMASSLAQAPAFLISVFINPIMMPAFSEINTDPDRISRVLFRITRLMSYVGFPLVLFCLLYGGKMLDLVYGNAYSAAAIPFALILTATMLRACSSPITTIYFAMGKPALQRRFVIIRAALMAALIYPLSLMLGLTGAALAGLSAMAVSYVFQVFQLRKVIRLDVAGYTAILAKGLFFSMPIFVLWSLQPVLPESSLPHLLTAVGLCLLAYGLLLGIYRRFLHKGRAAAA